MTAVVAEAATAAEVGQPIQALDTPALLVDLDIMAANISRMAAYCAQHGVNWRPHTKGVKVPAIARQEIAAGAIGITCAKLGEAEAMAAAGIDNILVANQVVGDRKIARLADLAQRATVLVAVDSLDSAWALAAAAQSAGVRLNVLVEVDSGMHRCGLQPGEPTVAFARQVHELPGLALRGVMAWEGHTAAIVDRDEQRPEVAAVVQDVLASARRLEPLLPKAARAIELELDDAMSKLGHKRPAVEEAVGALVATAEQCRAAGLPCEIVSCGGTGTYQITATIAGVTEIQAGGGIFGDLTYQSWGVDHPAGLSVLATVVSRPTPQRIVTDTGFKALGWDRIVARPRGLADIDSIRLSAEHGKIELSAPNDSVRVGDKLEFTAGYGDATVFLHDEMYGVRNGIVEAVWPVFARSRYR